MTFCMFIWKLTSHDFDHIMFTPWALNLGLLCHSFSLLCLDISRVMLVTVLLLVLESSVFENDKFMKLIISVYLPLPLWIFSPFEYLSCYALALLILSIFLCRLILVSNDRKVSSNLFWVYTSLGVTTCMLVSLICFQFSLFWRLLVVTS